MGWFRKLLNAETLENLDDLVIQQIEDLYSAERQLVNALPNMIEAAHSQDLKQAFSDHLAETRMHVQRLEQVFREFGHEPRAVTCEAMQGLIAEADELISMIGDAETKDAALIAAAQRVEHYEIAGYGCVRSFASRLGRPRAVALLQETLDEEASADRRLTQIAEESVNAKAIH